MGRERATELVLEAKVTQGVTFAKIAEELGADKVWATAAIHGQHPLSAEQADALCTLLELPAGIAVWLTQVPTRGSLPAGRHTDPTIYRLQEVVDVYGAAIKALIHEEFGDGIMSAINFSLAVERHQADGEERVRIVLDGKFLPYKW